MNSTNKQTIEKRMAIVLAIIGVAFIAYGVTIMAVKSGSYFFAVWYVIGALFIAAAFAVGSGAWSSAPHALRCTIIAFVAIAFIGFACLQGLIISEFNDQGEDDLDYILVLGAQVRQDGPSIALKSRLDAACRYLEKNDGTRCIVSGGQGPNEHISEAEAMTAYLVEHGVDPSRIIMEDQSLNTTQNIEFSQRFVDPANDRIGIVTSDYHLFRALAIARKHGFAHVCGIAAGYTPWYLPANMTRESLGIVKDYLAGNL